MKKKIEVVSHGNTWIDPSTPIVCPECASLNVKEYTYNDSEWHGPFLVGYSKKRYSCKDCDCCFKISKDKKSIRDCCWDDLFFIIFLFTFILALILLIISSIFWRSDNSLPLPMTIALSTDISMTIISFFAWVVSK